VKGVFRLRVERKQPFNHGCAKFSAFAVAPGVPLPKDEDDESEEDESESSGDHPKWHKKHHHHERMMENPAALEKCLQRLKQKRVKLQEKLVYLDSAAEKGNLGNGQHRHREKLESKVAFISSRIERLSEVASRQPVPNPQQPQQQTTTSSPPQQHHELPQQLPSANAGIPVPATNLSGQMTMPNKEELLAEYETLQNSITSLKFALREAHLQLQLRRTNLQAATYRRNDESSVSPVGPLPSEEQVKELKDALGTAKANEAAAKADLKAQVQKLHLLQHQLKASKQSEIADWKSKKAAKCQEKAAWKAEKKANKHQHHHEHHHGHHHGRRNYNNHDSFPESPVVQGSVSV